MKVNLNHKESLEFRQLRVSDYPLLERYFGAFSRETTDKFAPHGFDVHSIHQAYHEFFPLWGFILLDKGAQEIVAYTLIKLGLIDHERLRLQHYPGAWPDDQFATYAPSVADDWQGKGLAGVMLEKILPRLQKYGIRKVVLWGGVQASNQPALKFYKRHGFEPLGEFEHKGRNVDMILRLQK